MRARLILPARYQSSKAQTLDVRIGTVRIGAVRTANFAGDPKFECAGAGASRIGTIQFELPCSLPFDSVFSLIVFINSFLRADVRMKGPHIPFDDGCFFKLHLYATGLVAVRNYLKFCWSSDRLLSDHCFRISDGHKVIKMKIRSHTDFPFGRSKISLQKRVPVYRSKSHPVVEFAKSPFRWSLASRSHARTTERPPPLQRRC